MFTTDYDDILAHEAALERIFSMPLPEPSKLIKLAQREIPWHD